MINLFRKKEIAKLAQLPIDEVDYWISWDWGANKEEHMKRLNQMSNEEIVVLIKDTIAFVDDWFGVGTKNN